MQQDKWIAVAFVAVVDLYRTNTGNKRRRLKGYYWQNILMCWIRKSGGKPAFLT
jgi:hypothetical protein